MAAKIRLKRIGRKKMPLYKLVVMDRTSARGGSEIEDLGRYNPLKEPVLLEYSAERLTHWLSVGAQMTDPVLRLFGDKGVVPKEVKIPKTPGLSRKDKKKALIEAEKKR